MTEYLLQHNKEMNIHKKRKHLLCETRWQKYLTIIRNMYPLKTKEHEDIYNCKILNKEEIPNQYDNINKWNIHNQRKGPKRFKENLKTRNNMKSSSQAQCVQVIGPLNCHQFSVV